MSSELGKITFQKYTASLFANKDFETTPGKFELPTAVLPEIMSHIVNKSTYRELAQSASIENVSSKIITFRKLVPGRFKQKTSIGDGGVIDKMTIPSVNLQFDNPVYSNEGLTAADIMLGLPDITAKKLEKFLSDFMSEFDIDGFKEIENFLNKSENSRQKTTLNFSNAEPKEIYKKIVNLATSLTLLKDSKEGLNLIARDSIRIFVEPLVFDILAMIGLVGNRTMETMATGQYGIGILNGYKIISSPALSSTNIKVLVGTNFSCGAAFKLIAANVGRVGNTNDIQVYFEAMKLSGIVYPTTLRAIFDETEVAEGTES